MASINKLRNLIGSKEDDEWILTEIKYIDDGKEEICEVTVMHDGIKYTINTLLYHELERKFRELALQLANATKEIIMKREEEEE